MGANRPARRPRPPGGRAHPPALGRDRLSVPPGTSRAGGAGPEHALRGEPLAQGPGGRLWPFLMRAGACPVGWFLIGAPPPGGEPRFPHCRGRDPLLLPAQPLRRPGLAHAWRGPRPLWAPGLPGSRGRGGACVSGGAGGSPRSVELHESGSPPFPGSTSGTPHRWMRATES